MSDTTKTSSYATHNGKVLCATYGTLITGEGNHRCMIRANGTSIGKGKTVENCNMYSLGGFPKLSLAHNSHEIPAVVEVFETDDAGLLGPLDALEGYPSFYNRTIIDIALDTGETVKAWIYHIDSEGKYPIMNGDWVKRAESVTE